jgi:tetratricopeptide (TPR) repeat protein
MSLYPVLLAVLIGGLSLAQPAKTQGFDWDAQVRQRVAAHRLPEALQIVEKRLAEAPEDLEAAGWRARLLAWTGHLQEAEFEYRHLLAVVPSDVDLLVGLANVLTWQHHNEEALSLLENAAEIDPNRSDVYLSKGQALRGLGHAEQARAAFKQALVFEPANKDARAGLASLDDQTRYVLHLNTDIDTFSYTNTAEAFTANLGIRVNKRWSTDFSGVGQQLFGQRAGRFLGSATYQFAPHDSLTVGGGMANQQPVVPEKEGFFEYGRGFSFGESTLARVRGPLRGAEITYHQHWFWYQNAHVLVLTPGIVLYFARDWSFTLEGSVARSHLSGLGVEWQPSGSNHLDFPLHRSLYAKVLFGIGTENFAMIDQIGRFSARTFGGGLKYSFGSRQELTNYVAKQYRSQGQTQTSFGLSYAIHF